MKTITRFVFVLVAAVLTACATQPPRTLSALPDPPSARQIQGSLWKSSSGDYPGYQRILVDGQERYCRQNPGMSRHAESRLVCLTEAQVRTEHMLAQQSQLRQAVEFENATRPPTPNIDNLQAAVQAAQILADQPPVRR